MGSNKHFDPYWVGKPTKIKKKETPYIYVDLVWTDAIYSYYDKVLLQLIIFYNSTEGFNLQRREKKKIIAEIQRMTKALKR